MSNDVNILNFEAIKIFGPLEFNIGTTTCIRFRSWRSTVSMTPCKPDQMCDYDYLHVDSSIRHRTPLHFYDDSLLSAVRPNNQSSKMKGTFVRYPGSACDSIPGYTAEKFNQENDVPRELHPMSLSFQSDFEAPNSFRDQNGASFVQLSHPQYGAEKPNCNPQGMVMYLRGLLCKSEATQSTLHCKVKDSYKTIQNQTEVLLKNEREINSLSDQLKTFQKLCENVQTNEQILKMKNKQLETANQTNMVQQEILQNRITELQKDIQSIWIVHNALQNENSEKQNIVEKTLSHDLQAFESERTALIKEKELTLKRTTELEKYIQDSNAKLKTLEKENSSLWDEKQQCLEEKEAISDGHEQLKHELTICQQLCEKLIAEKAHLIQRNVTCKLCKRRNITNQNRNDDFDDNNNRNVTTDEVLEALCTQLPFIKVVRGREKSIDVVTKINEHVQILERQINTYKEQLEQCQQLLHENKEKLKSHDEILQCEKVKAETERNEIENAKKKVDEELVEMQKEKSKLKVEQSELRLSITEIEMEKELLVETIAKKDNEISLIQSGAQEKLNNRQDTICLLQEKIKDLNSEICSLKEKGIEKECLIEKRNFGLQTLQRRHSEGCIQTEWCVSEQHYGTQGKSLNSLQKQLEETEKERFLLQQELEQVVQHFKDAFEEEMAKEVDEERRISKERESQLLSDLENKRKECLDRKEHSIFVSKAYERLQGELESLWQEKEVTSRKCESLEYERNQLREQVEELCRSHLEDVKNPEESSPVGKKKSPTISKRSLPSNGAKNS